MTAVSDIAQYVVSGVVGAAAWELLRHSTFQLTAVVTNRLQQIPDISGRWLAQFEERAVHFKETINVTQRGRRVDARSTVTKEGTIYKQYSFEGTFHNGILNLRYENDEARSFEEGAAVLKLIPSGKLAEGTFVYLSSDRPSDIIAVPYVWTRSEIEPA